MQEGQPRHQCGELLGWDSSNKDGRDSKESIKSMLFDGLKPKQVCEKNPQFKKYTY